MDCKDCTAFENLEKRVKNNETAIKELDDELEKTVRLRIKDSEKQTNLYKLVEDINKKFDMFLEEWKADKKEHRQELKETNQRVSKLERRLDVNDTRTSRAMGWIDQIDRVKLAIIGFFLTLIITMVIEKFG